MFVIKPNLAVLLIFLNGLNCQRRIQNGIEVSVPKAYVVYLVRAPIATKKYDYWTCGGAIVSSEFVVTSAACVSDVNYLYVIAGYEKYVTDHLLEWDPCTKRMKKKVIYTCYPDGYSIKYERLEKWSLIDIALVKVESPYDFSDEDYTKYCSYIPTTIAINYESRYQEPGVDAMVLGWGHKYKWRLENDKNNYNQEILNFAPILIMEKEQCKAQYDIYANMSEVIDRYMICSLESGNIDESGEAMSPNIVLGCTSTGSTLLKYVDLRCQESNNDYGDDFRRRVKKINQKYKNSIANTNKTVNLNKTAVFNKNKFSNDSAASNKTSEDARRHGICQNDHGGPLVTWVGTHEVLIGVASVFKVSEESECIGPYLYTSTQCNGAFLDCVLAHEDWAGSNLDKDKSRRALCKKSPDDVGHPTVERHISWLYHPAGPADNEKHDKSRGSGSKKSLPPKIQDEIRETHTEDKKYLENGRYTGNEKFVPEDKYAPNVRYPANEKFVINNKYPANVRYGGNEKYVPNDKYPPNIRYTANDKYPANERYIANDKHVPNDKYVNDKYAPNVQYVTQFERHIPTQTNIGNVWFTRNERYKVSNGYPPFDKYVANDKHEALASYAAGGKYVTNDRYTTFPNILRYGNVNNEGLLMRPQLPLHI